VYPQNKFHLQILLLQRCSQYGAPIKNKFKQTISTHLIMCTVFWGRKGVLLVEFLPQGSTINAGVYCNTLKKLCHAFQNKRRGMLHDNVCPHTAAAMQDLIVTFGWEQFDHPPYNPDLVPSDFHLLKTFLGDWQFHDDSEVKEGVNTWFASQAASLYGAGIQKMVPFYDRCLNNG
jgi:hypothetical protein